MLQRICKATVVFLFVMALTSVAFSQTVTQGPYEVKAIIGAQNALAVQLKRDTAGVLTDATSLDFGTLKYDTTGTPPNNVYYSDYGYVASAPVTSNANNWQLAHTVSSVVNPSGDSLDDHINVTFNDAYNTDPTDPTSTVESTLAKRSFGNSTVTANKLPDGHWLKVYYGIARGPDSVDSQFGTSPITLLNAPGTYVGSVTFTLTPM